MFTLSALAITRITGQLVIQFVGIGLGLEFLETIPFWAFAFSAPSLPWWWARPFVVGGLVAFLALDPRRSGGWSFHTALVPVPIVGLVAIITISYRLIGLALFVGMLILYVRYLRGRGRRAPLAYTGAALVVICLLPIDLTLQSVPGPPRLVPAVSGLFEWEMMQRIERGDAVMVGGCATMYNEPQWLIVW
jgi:hypothetical protein